MEANKSEYFIDGFLLKYFNIWPEGINKNNLLYEQKCFIIYLIGIIPNLDDWSIQMNFQLELEKIKILTEKNIKISKADIDIAKIQGKNIEKLKKELLIQEKNKRISQLKKKFGIKEKIISENINIDIEKEQNNKKQLWDLLELKGFIKK